MAGIDRGGPSRTGGAIGAPFLDEFERLLAARCGYRFGEVQRQTLADAVRRRLEATATSSVSDYLRQLSECAPMTGEFAALLAEFTNTETHFFRHDGRFKLLREQVLPALVALRRPGAPLRVLSAGCSTGEEVYSTIMSLLEEHGRWAQYGLEVVGCDINQRALEQAHAASYRPYTLRYTPESFLDKYFETPAADDKRRTVAERVRRHARFHRANLVDDGMLALPGMRDFDVVFCCNVMIYMDEPVVQALMDRLYSLLSKQGYLFVGYTESLHARRLQLEPIWSDDYVVYRRGAKRRAPSGQDAPSRLAGSRQRPRLVSQTCRAAASKRRRRATAGAEGSSTTFATPSEPSTERAYRRARECCAGDRQQEALEHIEQVLAQSPFHGPARLLKGYLRGSQGEFWAAVAECTKVLDIDPVCAEAYLLLGLLLEQQGEIESALRETKRAIYLDPNLPLAYFTLARLYRAAGDRRAAARELTNTARVLQAKPDLPVAAVIPVEFDRRVLLQLTEAKLAALTGV